MSKLFIIAGHGAGDPGAVGGGCTEADLVRRLADRMEAIGGADVQVGDTSVNWYKSDYISKGMCPKGVPVIELHMDSGAYGAKGGHVIINSTFAPDAYDEALADFITGFFPGRSVRISKRSDLANPKRAAKMGVNYRLVECGFVSDAGDRGKFLSQMDDLAKGLLGAFGIEGDGGAVAPMPSVEMPDALSGFSDVDPSAWYVDGLAEAVEARIIKGYGNGKIGPTDQVTRGQAVCIIANAEDAKLESPFDDVVASPYYYEAVEWAKEGGIVNGSGGEFRPDDPCTREALCTMLHNLANNPEPVGEPTGYTDWGSVSEWARKAVAWAVEGGIVSGSCGRLRPGDPATRAEAAIIVMRFEKED